MKSLTQSCFLVNLFHSSSVWSTFESFLFESDKACRTKVFSTCRAAENDVQHLCWRWSEENMALNHSHFIFYQHACISSNPEIVITISPFNAAPSSDFMHPLFSVKILSFTHRDHLMIQCRRTYGNLIHINTHILT